MKLGYGTTSNSHICLRAKIHEMGPLEYGNDWMPAQATVESIRKKLLPRTFTLQNTSLLSPTRWEDVS